MIIWLYACICCQEVFAWKFFVRCHIMSWVNGHIVCFCPVLVVIRVDEVKVNIRVATFRHHVGPYHVFLKEKKQFSSKHQNKEKTKPETCKRDPAFLRLDLPRPLKRQCPQSGNHQLGILWILKTSYDSMMIVNWPPCRLETTWSSSLPLEADVESSSEPMEKKGVKLFEHSSNILKKTLCAEHFFRFPR